MTQKVTLKQDNFCLKYIETGNATEAYRQAYGTRMKDVVIKQKAFELMQNIKIKMRIDELRQPIMFEHKITVNSLVIELEEARQLALTAETPQASAAVAATMAKAKLTGLTESVKIEINNPIAILIQQLQGTALQVGDGYVYDWGDDSDTSTD